MKVTTDACLFGAWIPLDHEPKFILDIGAGTGLLSLMMAQRAPEVTILGVELDGAAAKQALENAQDSPFAKRISIVQQDVQQFAIETEEKFDLILSNPPFFKNHLHSPLAKVNAARHQETLSLEQLAEAIVKLLAPTGKAAILLPENEAKAFTKLMRSLGLGLQIQVEVLNKPGEPVFRNMLLFGSASTYQTYQLPIRNQKGEYSDVFKESLRNFYLQI